MSTDTAQRGPDTSPHRDGFSHDRRRALLADTGTVALAAALMLVLGAAPAAARIKPDRRAERIGTERTSKGPFGDIPKGPLQIVISISQQRLYLYSDGTLVADVPVATGVPGHLTPLGVFSIIDKDRYHHSNLYSNAPMPYMQRITWSGVALHEGPGVGRPASHGCIRMPHDFAARLWMLTRRGERVVIARNALKPVDFADPHLFVHKEPPADPIAAAPAAPSVKTAASLNAAKTDDAAAPLAGGLKADPLTLEPVVEKVPVAAATNSTALSAVAPSDQPGTVETSTSGAAGPAAVTHEPTSGSDPVRPAPTPKPGSAAKAPISVFISRKEGKIYVRQHFTALFDAPITIEHPEQPLGTHVFTALDYRDDGTTFRWNVMSLPPDRARAMRVAEEPRFVASMRGRRRKQVEPVAAETPAAPSPAEALARIDIPPDVVERISEMMVPGSSIIVSDHDLGPETGEGTDFIVVTR